MRGILSGLGPPRIRAAAGSGQRGYGPEPTKNGHALGIARDGQIETTLRAVELIPKAVVSGLFVQSQVVTTGPASLILQAPGATATRDTINRIWSDVVKDYPYQGLQLNPAGSGGAFVGSGPRGCRTPFGDAGRSR